MPTTQKTLLLQGGPGLKKDYLEPHFTEYFGRNLISFDYPETDLGGILNFIDAETRAEKNLNVVAHSWGAYLLMELFKSNRSWTTGKLALIAPFPDSWDSFQECGKVMNKMLQIKLEAKSWEKLESLPSDNGGPADLNYIKILEPLYVHQKKFADQVGFGYYNRKVNDQIYNSMRGYDHHEPIRLLKNPALLILGEKDFIQAGHLNSWKGKAEVQTLPNVGHSPYIEAKKEFFKLLDEFL